MTKLMFAFRNSANAPRNCSPLYSVHGCAVPIGRHELTPDVSLLQFFVTNEFEDFNGMRADSLCFGEARHSQMASHTASHFLHGVISRTAPLSSVLTLMEQMTNPSPVTVQLVPPIFAIQTPIRFTKCSNVSQCNALGLYRHSQ
jgi:hypothetical protein